MSSALRGLFLVTCVALLWCGDAQAQPTALQARVEGSAVTLPRPPLRIRVPASAVYAGAHRWVLYDVADCEVHVFIEADAHRQVQRLYWIQLEAYLASKPELRYNYDRDQVTTINGFEVRHRERFGPSDEPPRAGSDLEQVLKLVAAAGYRLPRETVNSRLVYLPDDTRRSEVMVIYIEDMASTGKTSADFMADGAITAAWPPVAATVLERARARISFERTGP